jgi:hypothetical protein
MSAMQVEGACYYSLLKSMLDRPKSILELEMRLPVTVGGNPRLPGCVYLVAGADDAHEFCVVCLRIVTPVERKRTMSSGAMKPVLLFTLVLLFPSSPVSSQTIAENQRAHVKNIETDTVEVSVGPSEPPLQMSLQKLMDLFKAPGFSIAVIDDYQIVWAKAYGVTDAGSRNPVTSTTLFQAGSISKPVAATGALWLVEQGKLSLDENVNEKLKAWKVPENEFTATQKVTLRRLMSHTVT